MDDLIVPILILFLIAILLAIVLPIIALVISIRSRRKLNEQISILESRQGSSIPNAFQKPTIIGEEALFATIQQLTDRVGKLEAAMTANSRTIALEVDERLESSIPGTENRKPIEPKPIALVAQDTAIQSSITPEPITSGSEEKSSSTGARGLSAEPIRRIQLEHIESVIGRRWLGWAAVFLILFAAAFFLKYAFDNRWIGELGRVAIGVAAGLSMTIYGFQYYKRGWRIFSQILTGGGIVLLYLSAYAAFGYYHLATQESAFVYLAILVAEAAALAYLYNAPSIALMALLGGFLTPILLHSDRDQYRSLFGYIAVLDIGALALLKRWRGLTSVAFAGTHLLFWLWYADNYHPAKLTAVMVFHTCVFLVFLFAHIGRQLLRHQAATLEDLGVLLINPFVYFATAYHFLYPSHHDWMGVFSIGMALIYAVITKVLLDRSAITRGESLTMIGIALTFVTISIPIQLQQNWITIGWSVEALLILWAGVETKQRRLRAVAGILFGFVLIRLVFWDTTLVDRPKFIPVFNKYFLSCLVVTLCLFGAAVLYQRFCRREQSSKNLVGSMFALVAIVTLWFVMSVETYTYFAALASTQKLIAEANHERWIGQMALSVLWSVYAGALAAIGFARRTAAIRWVSLALFGLTIIKAMLVDIAQLEQLYRIIVFFVLGVLLLVVAWGYQRAFHSRESPS